MAATGDTDDSCQFFSCQLLVFGHQLPELSQLSNDFSHWFANALGVERLSQQAEPRDCYHSLEVGSNSKLIAES